MNRLRIAIIFILLCSCSFYEKEYHIFDLSEGDFSWTVAVNNSPATPANLFLRNDSILVNLGRPDKKDSTLLKSYTLNIGKNGDSKELRQYRESTHAGSMLRHYSSCNESFSEFTCKVKLYDSSRMRDLKLHVRGINSRLTSPSDYLEFENEEGRKAITLNPNSGRLDIYDVVQYNPTQVIILFEYEPGEFDKSGKKVGLLDLSQFLENDGSNHAEYLFKKTEELEKKIEDLK
jgi:hypothetical protein